LIALLTSSIVKNFTHLHLGDTYIDHPEVCIALATSPRLTNLTSLDLSGHKITSKEVAALAASTTLINLTDLNLYATHLGDELITQLFSLANTLDGIRTICSLTTTTVNGVEFDINKLEKQETILNSIPALEILSFFNIVGIPCQSTIGDYPDPYRYNINIIHTGHFCSLADIMAHHDSNGPQSALSVPGFKVDTDAEGKLVGNGRIDNVIPILPPQLFQFLHTNAPSVLDFFASVGMRRLIASIPGTLPATLSAALLKMMKVVSVEPTEVNVTALLDLWSGLQAVSTVKYNAAAFNEIFSAIADARKPAAGAPTDRLLPTITSQLSTLLVPVLTLYRLVTQFKTMPGAFANTDLFPRAFQQLFKDLGQALGSKKRSLTTQMTILTKYLPTVLRAIYSNESWISLR
jgi:hypothetical protein